MSARLTLEFLDDGSMTYEHRLSKDSDERTTESYGPLNYLDIRHIGVLAGSDSTQTHRVLIMTLETYKEIKYRLDRWQDRQELQLGYADWEPIGGSE